MCVPAQLLQGPPGSPGGAKPLGLCPLSGMGLNRHTCFSFFFSSVSLTLVIWTKATPTATPGGSASCGKEAGRGLSAVGV